MSACVTNACCVQAHPRVSRTCAPHAPRECGPGGPIPGRWEVLCRAGRACARTLAHACARTGHAPVSTSPTGAGGDAKAASGDKTASCALIVGALRAGGSEGSPGSAARRGGSTFRTRFMAGWTLMLAGAPLGADATTRNDRLPPSSSMSAVRQGRRRSKASCYFRRPQASTQGRKKRIKMGRERD